MSSKKRNKKNKKQRQSSRRPPHPLPPRPLSSAPATAPRPAGPVETVPSEEPTFTGDDAAAWGWLNVWPFVDEGDGEQSVVEPEPAPVVEPEPAPVVEPEPAPAEPEPAAVEPVPVRAQSPTGDERAARPPVPPLTVFRTWSDEPASSTTARPRRLAGMAALVAVAVAIVVVGAVAWTGRGGDGGRIRPVHSDAYAAPVRLPPATSYVRSRVLPSGALQVTHWIHTRDAVDSLTVRTPRTLGLDPGSIAVSHVVLATDGTPYPAAAIDAAHQTFRFPVATSVFLRYRLSGAVQASGPDGRALARITSLDVSTGGEVVRTVRTVVGARVLGDGVQHRTAGRPPPPRAGRWPAAPGRSASAGRNREAA